MSDDSYTPSTEFDGDTSPEALAAWERYIELPVNPGNRSAHQREQDSFTAGYDAALLASVTGNTEWGVYDPALEPIEDATNYGSEEHLVKLRVAQYPHFVAVMRPAGPWVPVPTENEGEQ